jgi:signal transduction histidine kinase
MERIDVQGVKSPSMKSLPIIAAVALMLLGGSISLGIWFGLHESDDRVVREAVQVVADNAQSEIEGRIDVRLDALARMADVWVRFGPLDREQWDFQATMIQRDLPGFQAIEWIDRDFVVRWISPLAGNEAAKGLDITFESKREVAVMNARDLRRPSVSRTIDLVQGERGLLAYFPLYRQGEFEGLIAGVFRVGVLLEQVIPGDTPDEFELAIFEEGNPIFVGHQVRRPEVRMATSRTISLPGIQWRLRITPGQRLDGGFYRSLTTLFVVSAVLVTLLVASSGYFALVSRAGRRNLAAANTTLSSEITRREQAEADLRSHLDGLEKLVESRTEELEKVNVDLRTEVELHRRAKMDLEQNQSRLRHLTLDLSLSEDRHRKKVAERIHDRVSNGMVLAKLRLGELETESGASTTSTVDEINEILSVAIEESRSMVFELSPPILFELGLANALEWGVDSMFADGKFDVSLDLRDRDVELQSDLAAAVFRAFTELCMNVIKHAEATRVHVELKVQEGIICVAVSDDGVGIEPGQELVAAASGRGYGLFSICERFSGLGGDVTIEKSDLGGTRVAIRAPIWLQGGSR